MGLALDRVDGGAINHELGVKLGGTLDADVVNLSLGKTVLFDGREIMDRMIDELGRAGILESRRRSHVSRSGARGRPSRIQALPANELRSR